MSRLDDARRKWGDVFESFRSACEMVNSAWYEVENKQALKEEDVHRMRALIQQVQKKIDSWEVNGRL